MDRKSQPAHEGVGQLPDLHFSRESLANGISVYMLQGGSGEAIRMDVVSDGGLAHAASPLIASAANALITEGIDGMDAQAIANHFDYYGSFIERAVGRDSARLSLFALKKHLPDVLPLFRNILGKALFPEKEIGIYLQNARAHHLVSSEKVSTRSKWKFQNLLFGADHPYGCTPRLEDFNALAGEEIRRFHHRNYKNGHMSVYLSGAITESELQMVCKLFGEWEIGSGNGVAAEYNVPPPASTGRHFVEKKGAVQSSIRIGRRLFNLLHPDFMGMYFLNVLFGGYFGSRLMQNIREEKGFTYGIGSGLVSFQHDGYMGIASEVKKEVAEQAVEEVFKEMKRLQTEKAAEDEMGTVRNYIMGRLLRDFNGPFAQASRLRAVVPYGLGNDFYQNLSRTIQAISPTQLMELANKYLQADEMTVVIAGDK